MVYAQRYFKSHLTTATARLFVRITFSILDAFVEITRGDSSAAEVLLRLGLFDDHRLSVGDTIRVSDHISRLDSFLQ